MADDQKSDYPAAEAEADKKEEPANQDEDGKDDEKSSSPKREHKENPGDGLPKETPDKITFKWNKDILEKRQCDTKHMLYLLQVAIEQVRLRTIERNKYFSSIGRTDRFINHLNSPQIITNFIKWHNLDKKKNLFDGKKLAEGEKLHMINDMISEIGLFSFIICVLLF